MMCDDAELSMAEFNAGMVTWYGMGAIVAEIHAVFAII